jgi:SAM-dependent methyltransferase
MYFYDCPEAHDLLYSEQYENASFDFFKQAFKDFAIRDVLDCTVGTGMHLIPFAKMGCTVTGTDVNQHMLGQCRKNFAQRNLIPQLHKSDILELSQKVRQKFDAVLSTGNSLGHLKPGQLRKGLQEMDKVLKPGGVLYFDTRNWDLILERKQRFYLFNPILRDKGRVNYLQLWDYNKNGSITTNYLIFEEVENKIVSKRQFYTIYYPFKLDSVYGILKEMNYQNIRLFKFGDNSLTDPLKIDWYCIQAVKPLAQAEPEKPKKKFLFGL